MHSTQKRLIALFLVSGASLALMLLPPRVRPIEIVDTSGLHAAAVSPNLTDVVLVQSVYNPTVTMKGTRITFIMRVTNQTGVIANNVRVVNTIPAGMTYDIDPRHSSIRCAPVSGQIQCMPNDLGDMEAGSVADIAISYLIPSTYQGTVCPASFTNTATVYTTSGETNYVNNTNSLAVSVPCAPSNASSSYSSTSSSSSSRPASSSVSSAQVTQGTTDISLQQTIYNPAVTKKGTRVTYILKTTNASAKVAATNVRIVGTVPAGLTFDTSVTQSSAFCSVVSGQVNCAVGTLAAGATHDSIVSFLIPANYQGTTCPASVRYEPTVYTNTAESNYVNNTSTITTSIPCPTVVSSSNSSSSSSVVNQPIKLAIAQQAIGLSDTAVRNQKNVNLLRFEARATTNNAIRLSYATFVATSGSLKNAQNYSLWMDSNGDGTVDQVVETGVNPVNNAVLFDTDQEIPANSGKYFEVHADVSSSPASNVLQLVFSSSHGVIGAEKVSDSGDLVGISFDGMCTASNNRCEILLSRTASKILRISRQGDLFISLDSAPLHSHQLLGGTLGDSVLNLRLRAEKEDIEVTLLSIVNGGPSGSIERVELYRPSETTPFTSATQAGCSSTVGENVYCATMQNGQLVIPKGQDINVIARPRIKSDENGGRSGENVRLQVSKLIGSTETIARGLTSSNTLANNNGDTVADGEIFIGTTTVGPNTSSILGPNNHVVMSKIISITDANPDSAVIDPVLPSGPHVISAFTFTAARNFNTRNGANKAMLTDIIFNLLADNVEFDSAAFALISSKNSSVKHPCDVFNTLGQKISGQGIGVSGVLLVSCTNMNNGSIDTELDSNESATFSLEAETRRAQLNSSLPVAVQVSLENFNSIALNNTFGHDQSHIQWADKDTDSSMFQWIEYPETRIVSTRYTRTQPNPSQTTGNLYITKSLDPVRSRQLLGGTLSDPVMHLEFRAENEDIEVTDLQITASGGSIRSVDRLELYKGAETTPFAVATVGGCGADLVPANTMCANMDSNQLVVVEGSATDVFVRARMKTDEQGAVSGDTITFFIAKTASDTQKPIAARGAESSSNLTPNHNGNAVAEGEVFIGTNIAGPNMDIVGSKNVVVLSKIISITDANPDSATSNPSMPTGIYPIGQFRFTAASNSNTLNGVNKATIRGIIFSLQGSNVRLNSAGFKLYNKANLSTKAECYYMGNATDGSLLIRCSPATGGVNTTLDSGESATLVLEAIIDNPKVDARQPSSLSVSLKRFSDIKNTTFGAAGGNIRILDKDIYSTEFLWIEHPEQEIPSTRYSS